MNTVVHAQVDCKDTLKDGLHDIRSNFMYRITENRENYFYEFLLLNVYMYHISIKPHREKTGLLPMRKQRRRSASQ